MQNIETIFYTGFYQWGFNRHPGLSFLDRLRALMQQHPHIGFFIPLQHNSPVYDSNLAEQPAPVPPLGINLGNRKLDVKANGDKPSTAVRHVAENSFTHLGQYAISGILKPVDHHLAQAAGKSLLINMTWLPRPTA